MVFYVTSGQRMPWGESRNQDCWSDQQGWVPDVGFPGLTQAGGLRVRASHRSPVARGVASGEITDLTRGYVKRRMCR